MYAGSTRNRLIIWTLPTYICLTLLWGVFRAVEYSNLLENERRNLQIICGMPAYNHLFFVNRSSPFICFKMWDVCRNRVPVQCWRIRKTLHMLMAGCFVGVFTLPPALGTRRLELIHWTVLYRLLFVFNLSSLQSSVSVGLARGILLSRNMGSGGRHGRLRGWR